MAWPLIWLGGAALGALALADEKSRRDRLDLDRRLGRVPDIDEEGAGLEPSVFLKGGSRVTPEVGSVVCCHVYGVIEHTGIWLGDDVIAELHGSGLIRPVSINRFLVDRTGDSIYVACSSNHKALAVSEAATRATQAIFSYRDYDLLTNNCHRFVWQCLTGESLEIRSFEALNKRLSRLFGYTIYWDRAAI